MVAQRAKKAFITMEMIPYIELESIEEDTIMV
jgi:hypothetical protein